jgi:hypothetical protein
MFQNLSKLDNEFFLSFSYVKKNLTFFLKIGDGEDKTDLGQAYPARV